MGDKSPKAKERARNQGTAEKNRKKAAAVSKASANTTVTAAKRLK